MQSRFNVTNTGDLAEEIEKLKKENKEMKQRLEMLEETISMIKEDLYIDMEEELEDEEDSGCTGNCKSCKNKE